MAGRLRLLHERRAAAHPRDLTIAALARPPGARPLPQGVREAWPPKAPVQGGARAEDGPERLSRFQGGHKAWAIPSHAPPSVQAAQSGAHDPPHAGQRRSQSAGSHPRGVPRPSAVELPGPAQGPVLAQSQLRRSHPDALVARLSAPFGAVSARHQAVHVPGVVEARWQGHLAGARDGGAQLGRRPLRLGRQDLEAGAHGTGLGLLDASRGADAHHVARAACGAAPC